jgi:hypothetical protein
LAERALAEDEHLGWLHLEDRCPAVFVLEASVSDLIAPAPVPLPSPSARKPLELRVTGHPDSGAFDDDVGSVFPLVAPGRQDDVCVVCEVDGFLLARAGAEVDRVVEPDRYEWRRVRSAVAADGRDPEELGLFERLPRVVPARTASASLNLVSSLVSGALIETPSPGWG